MTAPAQDVRRGVVRQSGLTSVAATVAIGSGLLLDITIAARFGASRPTDAFVVAARIPLGLLAMLMATANQVLVPTFSHWLTRHPAARTSQLVSTLLVAVLAMGAALAGVLALAAGPLTALVAPGFEPAQQELASELARVMVLVVPLTAGSEVLRAYLNARYSFVVPAAMTVVLNLVSVAVILGAGTDISIVPVAYVVGGLVQFAVMLGLARWRGLRLRPTARLRDPELAATARLGVRPFLGSGLNPAARVVELLFASFLPAGSATILHYGNRLVSAIGGTVLFRSVVVALVPRLSRAVAEGRGADVTKLTVLGTRIMLALSLPLTALLVVLAVPAARLVFERGRFDADSATLLGLVLMVYAASFVGSAVQRALLAPFYAGLDTATPLRNTAYGVGANLLLLPLLLLPLRGGDGAVLAVAAAYSLSQYVHVAHAWHRLRRAEGIHAGVDLRAVRGAALRSTAAAVLAGGVMFGVASALGLYGDAAALHLVGGLAVAAVAGLLVVGTGESLGGGGPLRQVRRLRRGPAGPASAGRAEDAAARHPAGRGSA
jgi:putative peptidoglycan lipid II flippase